MSDGSAPAWLTDVIRTIPDFPRPGILFRDLSPLWASSAATSRAAMALAAEAGGVTHVVGIEARGFLVGMVVAQRLGVGFVPVRKAGKLPGKTVSVTYDLEYGTDTLELQADALGADDRVMILDDVIATGGTASAAASLVGDVGATVVSIRAVLELIGLGGRQRLAPHDVRCLWAVEA